MSSPSHCQGREFAYRKRQRTAGRGRHSIGVWWTWWRIVAALDALQAQAAASPPEQSVTLDVHGSDIAVTSEQVNVTVFPQTAQAYVTVGDAHVDTGTIERTRTWLATAKIGAEWTRTLSAMLHIVDELRKATGL